MQTSQKDTASMAHYEYKIRNVRFLGELRKFGLLYSVKGTPELMLENLKTLLDNFHA